MARKTLKDCVLSAELLLSTAVDQCEKHKGNQPCPIIETLVQSKNWPLTPYSSTGAKVTLRDMSKRNNSKVVQSGKGFLVVGVLAALGASVCCVGPLVLLALGVSGAWIGSLTALEPYRPIFIGLTLLSLGLAFYRLYFVHPACSPESACANPRILKRQRLVFWIVTVLVLGLIAVPLFAPLFY